MSVSANRRAIAAPIPRDAPATIASFFAELATAILPLLLCLPTYDGVRARDLCLVLN